MTKIVQDGNDKIQSCRSQKELYQLVQPVKPIPFPFRGFQRRQIIFHEIYSHASDVIAEILEPIKIFQIEIKELLITFIQFEPQFLYVGVREDPFVGAEEGDNIGEFVDFFVDL